MSKRFVVELLFDKEEEEFQPDRQYDDFEQARLHCALQVGNNPRVLQGRVRDQQASHFPFPYRVENADWAVAHLIDWHYGWPLKNLCLSCRQVLENEGHLPDYCETCGRG
jgi:hypothetical protein